MRSAVLKKNAIIPSGLGIVISARRIVLCAQAARLFVHRPSGSMASPRLLFAFFRHVAASCSFLFSPSCGSYWLPLFYPPLFPIYIYSCPIPSLFLFLPGFCDSLLDHIGFPAIRRNPVLHISDASSPDPGNSPSPRIFLFF